MHIDTFEYEIRPNEKGEMVIAFDVKGEQHTLGITEIDLKRLLGFFELSKLK